LRYELARFALGLDGAREIDPIRMIDAQPLLLRCHDQHCQPFGVNFDGLQRA